ncbi:MAG: hypothetical protein LQ342_003117 [Letrouitia transgressa]|nr:MAG: hypothetical protein LQ342_003117 [Letrouitia transgressa]
MRISGLSYYNTVDATWETFWQYVSASIGLIMTSIAAFRSLFISHHVSHRQQEISDFENIWLLYARIRQALRRIFGIQPWKLRIRHSKNSDTSECSSADQAMDLGKIERGTITGLRTFIHQYQRTPTTASQVMYSQTGKEVDERKETWPLPDKVAVRGLASHRHDKIPSNEGSGSHNKMLAHKESRKYDKMLHSQESRKHDKILDTLDPCEYDKVLAINGSGNSGTALARPEQVRNAPTRSVVTTGDSEFDGSSSWLRGSASGKVTPKTRVGIMSKMKCGGFVFSAGFKAERYREDV